MPDITYILELTVRDQPGVLVRIAQVFARRGCNIRAIDVTPHKDSQWSTMTITVRNVADIAQIMAQLHKLIDVRDAQAVQQGEHQA